MCISASDSILLNVLPTASAFISASVGPAFRLLMRSSFAPFTSTCLWAKALACKSGNVSFGFSASSFASLLFRALTYTSHTFLPKLIGFNGFCVSTNSFNSALTFTSSCSLASVSGFIFCYRVIQRVDQCLCLHITQCLVQFFQPSRRPVFFQPF